SVVRQELASPLATLNRKALQQISLNVVKGFCSWFGIMGNTWWLVE
ncbi:hypothetical protein HMPREF3216_00105, partial [Gardnerella vaginalis]